MPEISPSTISINGHAISLDSVWELGELNTSLEEVISFAKVIDPLPFHTDPEAAAKSHFGRLIAPGTMMYSEYHKRVFIPMFSDSIIAGQSVREWNFYYPHFPGASYFCTLSISELDVRDDSGLVSVTWHFVMRNAKDKKVQEVYPQILHRIDR